MGRLLITAARAASYHSTRRVILTTIKRGGSFDAGEHRVVFETQE
jgi:hypothetical protein